MNDFLSYTTNQKGKGKQWKQKQIGIFLIFFSNKKKKFPLSTLVSLKINEDPTCLTFPKFFEPLNHYDCC
jgi:hypothetical protein